MNGNVAVVKMFESSFNPLAAILNQNKLPRTNYVDWKQNLDIVLTSGQYKYVFNTELPHLLGPNASREDNLMEALANQRRGLVPNIKESISIMGQTNIKRGTSRIN